jgi:hypothetical protein
MKSFLVSAALALAFAATGLQADEASPEARYEAAIKILSTCQYCYDIRDTPEDLQALNATWTATQDWTLDYLNAHPRIDVAALKAVLQNAHGDYRVPSAAPNDVAQLAPGLLGFGTGDILGNTFLVARQGDRYRLVWDIRNLPAAYTAKFPVLAAWSAIHARESCRSKANAGKWDQCGAITGQFLSLPPDAQGHPRFYIPATYAQAMGETVSGQISIWSWNGKAAVPQFAKSYTYLLDDGDTHFANGILTVRAKGEFKSYYSCGACGGRPMEWTIRIDRDRVTDLGMKPVYPELDAVDALFYGLEKRQPVDDLIDPKAMAKLTPELEPAVDRTVSPPDFALTMIDYGEVRREKGYALACVTINDFNNELAFTVEKRNGRDFITDVAPRAGGKC